MIDAINIEFSQPTQKTGKTRNNQWSNHQFCKEKSGWPEMNMTRIERE